MKHVLGSVLIGMYANFEVATFENDVSIAFEMSKIATSHDISMHYQAITCYVYIRCFMRPIWF